MEGGHKGGKGRPGRNALSLHRLRHTIPVDPDLRTASFLNFTRKGVVVSFFPLTLCCPTHVHHAAGEDHHRDVAFWREVRQVVSTYMKQQC